MRRLLTIGAALALAVPAAALAQTARPKPAAPAAKAAAPRPLTAAPSEVELGEATETLSLLVSAFNSKDIPDETKTGLLLCLYGNPLGKLSRGLVQAVTANKQVDAKSPTQRLLVLAAICGAPLPKPSAGAAPEQPAGQPSNPPSKGN